MKQVITLELTHAQFYFLAAIYAVGPNPTAQAREMTMKVAEEIGEEEITNLHKKITAGMEIVGKELDANG